MKSRRIGQVSPCLMDGKLVFCLDQTWMKVFGKIPIFLIDITKEGRLNLCTAETVSKVNKK